MAQGPCYQALRPEFSSQGSQGGKREPMPEHDPLTSKHAPMTHMHIHTYK